MDFRTLFPATFQATEILDDTDSDNVYHGIAPAGSGTTAGKALAIWRIVKISPTGVIVSFAGGSSLNDKVWNDRASYEYS